MNILQRIFPNSLIYITLLQLLGHNGSYAFEGDAHFTRCTGRAYVHVSRQDGAGGPQPGERFEGTKANTRCGGGYLGALSAQNGASQEASSENTLH